MAFGGIMSLKYLSRIESDEDYYINNNYDTNSIRNLLEDISKAKTQLAEYEARLILRYNESTRATTYYRILANKHQSEYGNDKKVYIRVNAESYKKIDGIEVKRDFIYNSSKDFRYNDHVEALLYIYKLLDQYKGSVYYNETGYKKMGI